MYTYLYIIGSQWFEIGTWLFVCREFVRGEYAIWERRRDYGT